MSTRCVASAAGDVFSWVWHDSPDGPWLLDGESGDPTTPERIEEFLLRNRYWWLAGADTQPFREALADLFERYPVEVIAPDHGCVLARDAVERHFRMLDEVLESAADLPSIGLGAGRWSVKQAQ